MSSPETDSSRPDHPQVKQEGGLLPPVVCLTMHQRQLHLVRNAPWRLSLHNSRLSTPPVPFELSFSSSS